MSEDEDLKFLYEEPIRSQLAKLSQDLADYDKAHGISEKFLDSMEPVN